MDHWQTNQDSPETLVQSIVDRTKRFDRSLVICVDFFDTIVTRRVEPEYTKVMAAHQLSRLLGGRVDGDQIYRYRQQIEKELCEQNFRATDELEFRFGDLAQQLRQVLTGADRESVVAELPQFTGDMLSIEVAIEKAVQSVCPRMVTVLENLHHLSYPLLLLSDFYLPEPQFRELVAFHRLSHLFSGVYVSCDCGASKGSGKIYHMLCKKLQVTPDQLVMIGDNGHADITMARNRGLHAVHVQRQPDSGRPATSDRGGNQTSEFDRIAGALPDDTPFPELAFSLWRFTHLLVDRLLREKVRDVFFLSKEGQFLKQLFDRYQGDIFGSPKITSHYLLASRKSTFIGSLRSLDQEDFSRLLAHYRDLSIREFLQSLNFPEETVAHLIAELGGDCEKRLPNLKEQPLFADLLAHASFQTAYEDLRFRQRRNFLHYLDSFSVDYRKNGLHLVDVGWKGSIQDNIFHLLQEKSGVHGYYIGSLNGTDRSSRNVKTGLLFDDHPELSPYLAVYNNNRSLFEMMLGANHGSADWYRDPEAESDAQRSHTVHRLVELCHVDQEQQLYEMQIKPLQDKMLAVASDLNRSSMVACSIPDDTWFARHHARMVYRPTRLEVDWFEALYHLENFGIFEFTSFDTAHRFNPIQRLINLKNIIRHPGVLESGIWPPIILRRFGVGFWQHIDGRRRYARIFERRRSKRGISR